MKGLTAEEDKKKWCLGSLCPKLSVLHFPVLIPVLKFFLERQQQIPDCSRKTSAPRRPLGLAGTSFNTTPDQQ